MERHYRGRFYYRKTFQCVSSSILFLQTSPVAVLHFHNPLRHREGFQIIMKFLLYELFFDGTAVPPIMQLSSPPRKALHAKAKHHLQITVVYSSETTACINSTETVWRLQLRGEKSILHPLWRLTKDAACRCGNRLSIKDIILINAEI